MILTLTLTNERENKMTNTNNTIQKAYNNYSEVAQRTESSEADASWVELTTLFTESLTEAQKKRFLESDLIEQLDMIECSL